MASSPQRSEREPIPQSFPAAVTPDESVETARQSRVSDLTRVTVIGIAVRVLIITVEFIGVALTGSSSLFVDAIASLFDVVSSLVLLAAIRFAARPPDEVYPFGYGRAEPLAGFQLGVLLAGTGAWMAVQSFFFVDKSNPDHLIPVWVWTIPAGAIVLLAIVTYWIRNVGQRTRSTALQAEAMHFQVDAMTTLVTLFALIGAAIWRDQSTFLDQLGAGVLALLMILIGVQAAWKNLHQLLDKVPHDEDFARVRNSALQIEGVIDVEKVRIQHAGPDAHVDIDIEVNPQITVAESHLITQHVRARIQSDWPFVREVVVHVEPYYKGDH